MIFDMQRAGVIALIAIMDHVNTIDIENDTLHIGIRSRNGKPTCWVVDICMAA